MLFRSDGASLAERNANALAGDADSAGCRLQVIEFPPQRSVENDLQDGVIGAQIVLFINKIHGFTAGRQPAGVAHVISPWPEFHSGGARTGGSDDWLCYAFLADAADRRA